MKSTFIHKKVFIENIKTFNQNQVFSVLLRFVLKSSSPGLNTSMETSPERSNDSIHFFLRNFLPRSPKLLTKVVNVSDLHFIHLARER